MKARLRIATLVAVGTIYGVQGIAPAIPGIQDHLGLGDSAPGLLTAAYMLPAVLFALPFGYLADVVGRRWVFVVNVVIWSIAGAAQAYAQSFVLLLILRCVQGIGFAALMPLSVTIIGDALHGVAQMRAQASRQVMMTAGEFGLPLVGAALAGLSWNAPLLAQAALLPLAVVGVFVLDDHRHVETGLRGYGAALRDAVSLVGMPALLTAGFLRFWCKFATVSYVPYLLVRHHGASPVQAALVIGASSLVAAVVATQVVGLLRRFRASTLLSGSVVVVGVTMIGMALAPGWQLALAIAVAFGAGDGVLMVAQNAVVTEIAPPAVRAGLIAANGMVRNAGKLLGPLAVGALIVFISPALAVAFVGVAALATLPLLRPLASLDSSMADIVVVGSGVLPTNERNADASRVR
ncbi:MAG TPA: MFS transporter [Baekduia sp.]|uniref:MFS transporter n=1 Tax=Baekduia sp. TaxID=2600305 RepID=UPI002BB2673B|nr:MFS transporter [Baekduia sp.]HMJ36560.1 MFS transporter [Baekduia sp.]